MSNAWFKNLTKNLSFETKEFLAQLLKYSQNKIVNFEPKNFDKATGKNKNEILLNLLFQDWDFSRNPENIKTELERENLVIFYKNFCMILVNHSKFASNEPLKVLDQETREYFEKLINQNENTNPNKI